MYSHSPQISIYFKHFSGNFTQAKRNVINFTVGMQGRNFLKEHEEFAAEVSSYGTFYGYPDAVPKDLNLPEDFAKEVDPDVVKYARVPIPYDYKTHYFFLLQYDALKR
jgi:hypothetical protein